MKSADLLREREQRRRAYYREAILHAAERVILRKGYSATTMDDVAREARLSKATIYKYIPGKGVLLYEILSHYFDDLRHKMESIESGPGTAGERLASAIRMALRESESKQSLTRVLWMDKSMLKLMHIFAAAAGKTGDGLDRRPEEARPAPREAPGVEQRGGADLPRRRGLRRVPAPGYPAGRGIPRGRGRRLRPSPFLEERRSGLGGRGGRAGPIRPRRHPEPRTNPEGELT